MGRALHRAVHRVVHRAVPRSITLNLGVGCAPSCWPIFGFRNLLGARRGAEGSFLCSPSSRFSGGGGGVGSPPGRGGEWGCHGYWRGHRVSPRHTRKRTPAQYSPPFFLLACPSECSLLELSAVRLVTHVILDLC